MKRGGYIQRHKRIRSRPRRRAVADTKEVSA
jgi:hypothetical protein